MSRNEELSLLSQKARMMGAWFYMGLGLVGAVGTAVVYWYGGYLVIQGEGRKRDGNIGKPSFSYVFNGLRNINVTLSGTYTCR